MPSRYRPSRTKNFPPLLRGLVRAAHAECPPRHAEALEAFVAAALNARPHGGHGGQEAKAHLRLEAIAEAHLELDNAAAAFRSALSAAGVALTQRHGVTRVVNAAPGDLDTAYFYAGLAFGLIFTTREENDEK